MQKCIQQCKTVLSLIEVQTITFDNCEKLNVLTNDLKVHKTNVESLQDRLHDLRDCQVQQSLIMTDLRDSVKHLDNQVCDYRAKFNETYLILQQTKNAIAEKEKTNVSFQPSDDAIAITALKELCWQVTTFMYWVIFPESYAAKRRYSFEDLQKNIDRLKDDRLKQEKNKSLDELVKHISWTDDMQHKIPPLLEGYELQPVVKPFELNDHTIELIFTSDILIDDEVSTIRELVNIWQCLNNRPRKT